MGVGDPSADPVRGRPPNVKFAEQSGGLAPAAGFVGGGPDHVSARVGGAAARAWIGTFRHADLDEQPGQYLQGAQPARGSRGVVPTDAGGTSPSQWRRRS